MYYNDNLKQLNIGLCVIIFICAFLSMLKIIEGEFITKIILVGLSLQQITLAYNEYKLKKTHRAVFSLFVAILIGIAFIKISK